MRPLGPAIRPGSPVQASEIKKNKRWFKTSLFRRKQKTKPIGRVEPPLTSQPQPVLTEADKIKKPSVFARFFVGLNAFRLPRLRFKLPKLSFKRARPDPAPSRMRYIWSRLMLRPRTRLAIVKGIPTLVGVALVLVLMSNQDLREDISETYKELRNDIVERPELYVQVMQVTGASQRVDRQIRLSSGLSLPVSSFEVDLLALRARLERLDAVKTASVYLRAGGVLQVDIEERVPVALWRGPTGLETIDVEGERTSYVERRSAFPGLPLIAGAGAKSEIAQALHLMREARPIAGQIRALRRVSQRRWDVVLANDVIVKLPQEKPGRAMAYVLALHNSGDVFSKNIKVVDLRDLNRPVVRVAETKIEAEEIYATSATLKAEE